MRTLTPMFIANSNIGGAEKKVTDLGQTNANQ
jgi:hypothetical protein